MCRFVNYNWKNNYPAKVKPNKVSLQLARTIIISFPFRLSTWIVSSSTDSLATYTSVTRSTILFLLMCLWSRSAPFIDESVRPLTFSGPTKMNSALVRNYHYHYHQTPFNTPNYRSQSHHPSAPFFEFPPHPPPPKKKALSRPTPFYIVLLLLFQRDRHRGREREWRQNYFRLDAYFVSWQPFQFTSSLVCNVACETYCWGVPFRSISRVTLGNAILGRCIVKALYFVFLVRFR